MSTKSPIFPMPEPQHFSDYGFDPQVDYFQVLEEARKHKRETSTLTRSIDSLRFKFQKSISKEEQFTRNKAYKNKKKRSWLKNALFFFKWKKWKTTTSLNSYGHGHGHGIDLDLEMEPAVHRARARAFRTSISGPVYVTESRSGSNTPCRTMKRPSSGPLAGTLLTQIPYLSLRELNMEHQQRVSTSAMPIYLVT